MKLEEGGYKAIKVGDSERFWLPEIQLGLGIWEGEYDGIEHRWLRWYDAEGWVLTPMERERKRAESERQRAEQHQQLAESERQRAESERQRAERLIAQLRELGIEPDGENR